MKFSIGNIPLGPEYPAYIVLEMSANHGGRLECAKQIIADAKEIGASAVKLQTYTADSITLDSDKPDFTLPKDSPWSDHGTMYELYKQAQTPFSWHKELFAYAKNIGIDLFSAPFDTHAVDFLETFDPPAYKIASPEITDITLIRACARTQKPIILSSGIAEEADLDLAIKTIRDTGNEQIIVLKCTTAYPTPLEEVNLNNLKTLQARYGVLVGVSDHTKGYLVPSLSVGMGGVMIEKHYRLDDQGSVDDFFSMSKKEFAAMVNAVRETESILGHGELTLSKSAWQNRRGRRSLYVAQDIDRGETFTEHNIKSVRPGFGLHPKYFDAILGKTSTMFLKRGDRLTMDCILEQHEIMR